MERAIRIFKTTDWRGFYFFSLGALIASQFNINTTLSCMIGAALGFLLLNAVTRWNN